MRKKRCLKEIIVNIAVLAAIMLFILQYYKPELMLMKTITTGGDMGSDYYPALYLKDYLIPHGKLAGWSQGWYLGMPMFQFYFLPSFVLMALLSYLIPLEIAFKLVTALGIFMLPLCAWLSFRLMRIKFPGPAIAALFTLPFLFMEANSMWGGNIPSTLAGEFSYSISLALTVVFFGLLYRAMEEKGKKYIILSAVLFTLIITTHVYTAIFAFFSSSFFLVRIRGKTNRRISTLHKLFHLDYENFIKLVKIYFVASLISAFWLLPMAGNMEYTTSYADTWNVKLGEIFPAIIVVFLPLIAISALYIKENKKAAYLFFSILIGYVLFLLAESFGTVNIRFVPFIQLFLMLLAAMGLSIVVEKKLARWKWLAVCALLIVVLLWVQSNVTYIGRWIEWNYEGFEKKNEWGRYKAVNDFLSGNQNDPRVVFEHSGSHNAAGTVRAFESLPLFSGRSNMEGLFMQSTPSSPFVFYVQSEMSKENSCPFWNHYPCTTVNIEKGTEHLKMFNVKHFIARSDEIKALLANDTEYALAKKIDYYEIYELKTNPNHYVTVPKNEPLCIEGKWKNISYQWFSGNDTDVPLVFKCSWDKKIKSLSEIKRIPVDNSCKISESVENEEITFSTDCVGKPHIISISYHPAWHVEGAKWIYLVSPSFMLVYPEQSSVRLHFGETIYNTMGNIMTIAGIIILLYFIIFSRSHSLSRFFRR